MRSELFGKLDTLLMSGHVAHEFPLFVKVAYRYKLAFLAIF